MAGVNGKIVGVLRLSRHRCSRCGHRRTRVIQRCGLAPTRRRWRQWVARVGLGRAGTMCASHHDDRRPVGLSALPLGAPASVGRLGVWSVLLARR
jgi:hypothetical protein